MSLVALSFSIALVQENYVMSILDLKSSDIEHVIDVGFMFLRMSHKYAGDALIV